MKELTLICAAVTAIVLIHALAGVVKEDMRQATKIHIELLRAYSHIHPGEMNQFRNLTPDKQSRE